MIWDWLSFMAGIGAAGVVCVIVGLVLTYGKKLAMRASE